MLAIAEIQSALQSLGLDGWLLYDFRGSNILASRVLQIPPEKIGSRRYAYCIPAIGTPRKLVHRIEAGALDHLPGEKTVYLPWQEFEQGMAGLVTGMKRVAMEYASRNSNPYISRVDAGTVELLRSFGVEPTSSGDLIQKFEATWDDVQWQMHRDAAVHTDKAFEIAWSFIASQIAAHGEVSEIAVRDEIMRHFAACQMTTYHPPIVAVGRNSGNPHYDTGEGEHTTIQPGDFVLIDLWAKLDRPRAVYSDLTRVGYVGTEIPEKYRKIFDIVAAARDTAIETVRNAFRTGRKLQGWEVDRAARDVINNAGYGEYFVHRTGHSIGQETHGNGANMDDLETHEERSVMRRTCFSIEPGIYLPDFGIRLEVDVYIDKDGTVHVTGGEIQREIVKIG